MRVLKTLVLLALPALVAGLLAPVSHARQEGKDPAAQIASFEKYLARKPHNEWALSELVAKAVSINGLEDLVTRYEERVAEDPADNAAKVVLARLYAATGEDESALELLDGIEDKDARLWGLIAELHLGRNAVEEALAALEEAVGATDDEELLEALHKKRGRAFLAAGQREEAYAAFQALAALDPESFHLRLEAATQLADHGLFEEALTELAAAEELAADEVSKRCRVMAEMGRLQERLTQVEEALATYRAAIALMGRGHWLKRDLYERVVAVHKRAGTLEGLLDEARNRAAAAAQDLDAREFHARVLEELARRPEARDVLAAATADFPADLSLSRKLIETLDALEDTEGLVAEYQRILLEKPEELELYLELGKVFARDGRLEQARLQWNRTLEQRLDDPGLCVRLASFYALYDQAEDAVAMYAKAIDLEPAEMRHYADLAAFLAVRDRKDEIPALLERAAEHAAGNVSRLDDLSALWSEYGHPTRAREALEAALAIAGDDARLWNRLADLLIREGESDRASELLHQVIEAASEATLRTSAVDKLVRLYGNTRRTGELARMEEEAIDEGTDRLAPYLVLGKLHRQRRDPEAAIGIYEKLLAVHEDNEESRKSLARMYEDRGDHRAALEQYQTLMAQKPQARRTYLKEIARIHLTLLDQDAAFACYEEILADAPDNPAAFEEVAQAYEKLGLFDEVAECMQQAVRLAPTNGEYRLDLAEAYKRMGEWDKAREQTLLAIGSDDEDTSDKARKHYYVLLSEAGRIEEEIQGLRRRVQDNPYDSDSPLTLIDIYVRELEYELALELLERLLSYQPKEPKLLEQRARLYALMERYDEAVVDYETLWKLPDSDRQALALEIAEASIQDGALSRAEQVLAQVSDTSKIASLYQKHDLYDEAIAALEQGIAGAPSSGRLLLKLASVQEAVGRRDDAAETLERMLSLQGDSWRVLVRLGNLYEELHDKERSLEIGGRLFAMLRTPDRKENDDPDEEAKEDDPWNSSYRYSWWYYNYNTQYRQRLEALKEYFESKGHVAEFLELGITEARKHPANSVLFDTVWYTFNQVGEREADARALVREVRERTVAEGRTPPGYTPLTWARNLESREVGLYRENASFAEERLAELTARAESGEASEDDFVERAQLLGYLQRDDERGNVLREGLERFPDSEHLLAALGVTMQSEKKWDAAADAYRALVPLLEESGLAEDEVQRLEIAFRQQRGQLLQGFPPHVQRRVKEEHLRRMFHLTQGPSTYLSWGLGTTPSLDGARLRLAQCLFKLEDHDAARAVLVALEPQNPEFLPRWTSLAKTYFKEELYEDAERIHRRLLELDETLGADPVLGHNRSWSGQFNDAMKDLAFILEKRGEHMAAFDLLRAYGSRNQGELLLTTHELFEAAEAHYGAQMEAAAAELVEGADADTRAWRNAALKLADVYAFQKRWDEVLAVHEEVAARLTDDFSVLENVAALHQRAGRMDEAIATRYAIIDKKRELNRLMRRRTTPEGRALQPVRPPGISSSFDSNVSRLGRSYYGSTSAVHNVREDFSAILKLYLDQKRTSEATEVLRQIAREDAVAFRRMGYAVRNLVQQYQLGAEAVPILRLLHSYAPDDMSVALEYAKALTKAKKLEDAHKVLTQLMNKARGSSYYVDQARRQLDELELRMGWDEKFTLEDLREAAEADVKNVRSRMKLARRLFKLRSYEEALTEGRRAEELAPHLDYVSTFVTDCLQVLGRGAELEERLLALRQKERDKDKKFVMTVRVANWMYERGEREPIAGLFGETFQVQSGGWVDFAPSSWYIEKGEYDEAKRLLEEEIGSVGRGQWVSDEAKMRLEALHLLDGDPSKALDEAWKRFEKAGGRQAKITYFGQLAGILRRLPDLRTHEESLFARAAELGGLRGELYEAAYYLALGEMDLVEARLDELSTSGEDALFLYPVLVDFARQRGDLEAALAYLERLQTQHELSRSRKVGTAVGSLSESDAVTAEKAGILFDLGREDEAFALFEDMLEEYDEDEARPIRTSLARLYERWEEAAALTRERIEEEGEKSYGTLTTLADYELELGNDDEAQRLLERALILSGRNATVRTKLIEFHRAHGQLAEHLAALVEESAADPDDAALTRVVARVALEVGEEETALAALERLAERPEEQAAILPMLMHLYMARGDAERAFEARERLLASGAKANVRQSEARLLAERLLREGAPPAKAVLRLEEGFGGDDTVESRSAVMRFLTSSELWEEALVAAEAVLELAPKNTSASESRIEALGELGRQAEALELCFVALVDPELEAIAARLLERVAVLARGPDAEPELLERAASDASDVEALYRLGMLYASRRDWAAAVPHLERLLALEPGHRRAMTEIWRGYLALDRLEEAALALERLIEELDREQGVLKESWRLQSRIDGYRRKLGELRFLRGDRAGGLAEWERPIGQRFRAVQSYSYAYYNSPLDGRYSWVSWLRSHGLYSEYVEAERARGWFDTWNAERNAIAVLEARFDAGERDEVLEETWIKVSQPGRGLVQAPSADYYYSSFDTSQADPNWRALVRFFREEGRLDELAERIAAELEADAEDDVILGLRDYMRTENEDWEAIAAARAEVLEENEDDVQALTKLAEAYRELGRYEEALELFERAFVLERAKLPEGSTQQRVYRTVSSSGRSRGTAGKIRFRWGGSSGSSSGGYYTTSYSTSSARYSSPSRRATMALLAKLGRNAEARELEETELRLAELSTSQWRSMPWTLAAAYGALDLDDDVERLGALAVERSTDEGRATYRRLVDHFQRRGDDARRRKYAEALLPLLDRAVAEAPYDPDPLVERAKLHLWELADATAARADCEHALALERFHEAALVTRAWVELEDGAPDTALALFEEAERIVFALGLGAGSELWYGLGLARAAAGDDTAQRPLRKALVMAPEHRAADRARAALP